MRVAVAGGTGFLGQAVVRRLRADGHAVVVLARRPAEGVTAVDVAGDAAAVAAAIAGCDAVVNLVGIKWERGQSFAAAHVDAVERLIAACRAAGISRLVHVSVVGARPEPRRPYLDSKWRGEQAVTASGLAWTIVRPGVIAGPGDDFLTNLAAMLRHAAVFPAPGGGAAPLQPVVVDDVAAAVAAVLARPDTAGARLDVVGPERLPLRAWVLRVAAALGLRAWVLPAPRGLLAPAVAAMERVLPAPPLTRAQLGMLGDGMVGDPAPARALGLTPTPLTPAWIAGVARDVPPWLGVSLRLPRPEVAAPRGRVALLALLGALTIAGMRAATPDIWRCMLLANLVLVPAALVLVPLPWRALLRPRAWHLAFGTGAALALYGLGWLGAAALRAVAPGLMAQAAELYAWGEVLPVWQALPLLLWIVLAEELVWRAAVALPVGARMGPWWGCAAAAGAFAAAHVAAGPPVLWLAAAACGLAWAWMVVRARSVVPALVCHYLWDVAVMFVAPY